LYKTVKEMEINMILACDEAHGIGKNGTIPWHSQADLGHFSRFTSGHVVVMGRNTWESLPKRPLPRRVNIILSTKLLPQDNQTLVLDANMTFDTEHWDLIFRSLRTLLECFSRASFRKLLPSETAWVIGGRRLYQEMLPFAHNIYVTWIKGTYDCDTKAEFLGDMLKGDWFMKPLKDCAKERRSRTDLYREGHALHTFERTFRDERRVREVVERLLVQVDNAQTRLDRTRVGVVSEFGTQLEFDLSGGILPLSTLRRQNFRAIFEELMWMLRGQTDSRILEQKKIHIWKPNTTREFLDAQGLSLAEGDIGGTYGHQYRHFGAPYRDCHTNYSGQGFDQLAHVIHLLKTNPTSRRMVINLWNPAEPNVALPPCVYGYQFFVEDGALHTKMIQRSSDFVLAGAWNIATGALFSHLLAHVCGLKAKRLIWSAGDVHLYLNQVDAARELVQRPFYPFPVLHIREGAPREITAFEFEDVVLLNYRSGPAISIAMNA